MTKLETASPDSTQRRTGRPRNDLTPGITQAISCLTRSQLARVFRINPGRIDRWRDHEGMPTNADGSFDLVAVWQWREARLASRIAEATKSGAKADSLDLLRRVRAEREQLKLSVERGVVIGRQVVAEEWRRRVLAVRSKLLALPRLLAGRCKDSPPELIEAEAMCAVRDMLEDFAAGGDLAPAVEDCDVAI